MANKGRFVGDKPYTFEQHEIVRKNWVDMSDRKLSSLTGKSVTSIQKYRNRHSWNRHKYRITDMATKAKICEMFTSEIPIKEIASTVGKSYYHISRILSECLFGKVLDRNAKVITLSSSV